MGRFLTVNMLAMLLAANISAQVVFNESASQLNMGEYDFSSGVAIVDVNNDLVNEVLVANVYDENRLYIRHDSIFADMAHDFGVYQTYYDHTITVADVNFDNLPDFYITSSQAGNTAKLFVSNYPGPFLDLAEQYNLRYSADMGAAFFQMTPHSGLCILSGRRLMVLQNDTFVDITQGSGMEGLSNVFCPVFFDIDGDIDDDLFIAGNWELNHGALFRNNGDGTFTDISDNTDQYGFGYGQGVTFGDIDNDGDFDIYLTSGFGANSMWANDGTGFFTNVTEISNTGCGGYSRASNFADFDNDTDIDLYINRASAPKMLYLNNGEGIFHDVSEESGIADTAGGFGSAVGDLDNNGQIDIVACNSDYVPKHVFVNLNDNPEFLKLKVIGNYPNTMAVGAIVELYADSGPTTSRTLIGKREISSHSTMHGVNELLVHFGTGDYTDLEVVIYFQSLAVKDTSGISPGQTIILEEPWQTYSDEQETPLPRKSLSLKAYPNPFNAYSRLVISGGNSDSYEVKIFDIRGRELRSVKIENQGGKVAFFVWDGRDEHSVLIPSGVYFVRVRSGEKTADSRLVLLR
jgi:hypothetical protein